jgi:putative spermidine/putrescine transport system permease protein
MTRFLLGVYFAIAVAFLVMPLVLLVPISLTDSQFLEFPPKQISLRWYREFFVDQSWVAATVLSFKVGVGATLVALVVGTLASVAIVRGTFPGRRLLHAMLVAPLIIPTVILALALFIVFLRWKWVDSVPALIFAHAVVALPYVVLIVSSALRSFDTTLERAARVLGAGPVRAFFSVTLPYLGPSMFASSLLAFFASFDELIITLFVSGGLQTLPVRIWTDLMLRLDPTVAAAATMLIVVSVAGMAIAEYFRQRNVRRYGT